MMHSCFHSPAYKLRRGCRWTALALFLMSSFFLQATDVTTADALQNAVKQGDSYIRLMASIELGDDKTLTVSSGTIVLDLNGKTLSATRTSDGAAKCIEVDGGNLTIRGGGTITATAKGTYTSWFQKYGYDACGVAISSGTVAIHQLNVTVSPTEVGNENRNGKGYPLDPNNDKRLYDMVPNGCLLMQNGVPYTNMGAADIKGTSASVELVTYMAKFYDTTGENQLGNSFTYNLENPTGNVPSISKTGYTLKNWTYEGTAVNTSALPTPAATSLTADVILRAAWEAIDYTLTFELNGGSFSSTPPATYTIESPAITLPTPTYSGQRFLGWFTNSSFTGSPETTLPTGSYGNKTYYAKWSKIYTITYEVNGGTLPTDAPTTYISEEIVTLPLPVKAKNEFRGWFESALLKGEPITQIPLRSAGNKTYYARWLTSFTILCHWNDGVTADKTITYSEETETFTLPTDVTRRGYELDGWYANAALTGNKIVSIPTGSQGDKEFYAKWNIIHYSLNYHANGGEVSSSTSKTYTVAETVTLPLATREHYTFAGWYKDEACQQPYGESIPTGTTGDKTLYAKWKPVEYTLTLDMQGGEKLPTIPYSMETDHLELPVNGVKRGYTFAGWYKDAATTQPFGTHIEKGTSGNFTLYAKWTPTRYTITYDCYYGTNPSNAPASYTIEETVVLPFPHRANFSFIGWYANDELTGEIQTSIPEGNVGNRTFYARWAEGNLLNFSQPESGKISVKSGTQEMKSGTRIGAGTSLSVEAVPTDTHYKLSKLVINGEVYTSSPQTVTMPADGGLTISALFSDPRPTARIPEIITFPENTLYIPSGDQVSVTLKKSDEETELFYSLDGNTPQRYTGPFHVSSQTTAEKTVQVTAYARKEGHKDGVATRDITFRSSRITITFELPKGITAIDPDGGDVISAVATGGTFRFKLKIDADYFPTLDSVEVTANGVRVRPDIYDIYTLADQAYNVVVNVKGITGQTYTIALEQTPNGEIYFTDEETLDSWEAHYGDQLSISAKARPPYKFLQWEDGSQTNPRLLTVEKSQTIKAYFTSEQSTFLIVLPEIEGATVKPLTGYSTGVLPGGKFKCYLKIDDAYSESTPVLKVDDKVLEPVQQVYSIYDIQHNIRISVEGIRKNEIPVTLKSDLMQAIDLSTGKQVNGQKVQPGTLLSLYAEAPQGKIFSKWNDGKADNPRLLPVEDALALVPLFDAKGEKEIAQLTWTILPGVGLSPVNANIDALPTGENIRIKLILLPAYSQSRDQVKLTANGEIKEPELSVRSATQTETLYYSFPLQAGKTTLSVSGLKRNRYSLHLNQPARGSIQSNHTGELEHGTLVTLTAQPANGDMFKKWNDGNTLNPYTFELTSDREITASFLETEFPASNEPLPADVRIYTTPGQLHVNTAVGGLLRIWTLNGQLIRQVQLPGGQWSCSAEAGFYLISLDQYKAVKVLIN